MTTLFDQNERRLFHDKAWKRAEMPAWDARWARLSVPARRALLDTVKTFNSRASQPVVNASHLLDQVSFALLSREGFIESAPNGFLLHASAYGFIARIRALKRLTLLDPRQPTQFDRYLNLVFANYDLGTVVASIVERHTGQKRWDFSGDIFDLFVRQATWPEWVADFLEMPATQALVTAIDRAGKPVAVDKLIELVPEQHPSAVRGAFDALVNHLALYEDIDPNTLDIVTGFLPVVCEERHKIRTRKPATLAPVEPAELAPEGGVDVPDLRAVLLEVSAGQPQVKQNETLFAKEQQRFLAALDPLPDWFPGAMDRESRLRRTLFLASALELTCVQKMTDKSQVLTLTAEGQCWLIEDCTVQEDAVFAALRDEVPSPIQPYDPADVAFLGCMVRAGHRRLGLNRYQQNLPLEARQPLREAVHSLFAKLPPDKFFQVETFLKWASEPERNPLLLGHQAREVVVYLGQATVPSLDAKLADACGHMLRDFLKQRLYPFGCVRLGRDAQGKLILARSPRLDAYFGQRTHRPVQSAPQSRVIVQPDFTVVVIGLDHTPVAELSPFCDRIQGRSGQGALTMRLSRESIFRGMAAGLKSADILDRLRKQAGNTIPANVLTEVTGWCEKTRSVKATSALLIRCPDAETASRVASVLGKNSERIGETAVAFNGKLTLAIRQRLQAQGVMVAEEPKPKKGK